MATIDAEEIEFGAETCKSCVELQRERDLQAEKCEKLEKQLAERYKDDDAKDLLLSRAQHEILKLRGIITAFRNSEADDILQKMDADEADSVLETNRDKESEAELDTGERKAKSRRKLNAGKRKPKRKADPKPQGLTYTEQDATYRKKVVTSNNGGDDDDDNDDDDVRGNVDSEKSRACYQLCRWLVAVPNGSVKKCSKVFMLNEMENHISEVHIGKSSSSTSYPCMWEDCERNNQPFKFMRGLLRHVRCHALDKKFRCTNKGCGRCFSGRRDLEEHERGDCPFKAVTRKPLARKQLIAKPKYRCTYEGCDRTFLRKVQVDYHYEKVHVGVEGYKCTLRWCGRVFPTPNLLRKHRVLHTRERPYLCDFPGCDRGFADEEGVEGHRGSHPAVLLDLLVEPQRDGESAAKVKVE